MTTKMQMIAYLVEVSRAAIRAGDWKVDGACDPDSYLSMAEAMLEQEGWHSDGITGETWKMD